MRDSAVQNNQAFLGSVVVNYYTNARAFAVLWNPVTSERSAYLDLLHCTHSNDNADGFDLRFVTQQFGTLCYKGINKCAGGPEGVCEIRWGNVSPADVSQLSPTPVYEMWTGTKFKDRPYPFDPPILLNPGHGAVVISANTITLVAAFQWREQLRVR